MALNSDKSSAILLGTAQRASSYSSPASVIVASMGALKRESIQRGSGQVSTMKQGWISWEWTT